MAANPHRESLRFLLRDPALFAVELFWRWSFGLGLLALAFFAYAHLRRAVMLSSADELSLHSTDPLVAALTAARLLAAAIPSLLGVLFCAAILAALLWIAAATLGRGILTRVVVRSLASSSGATLAPDTPRWGTFAALHFARVLMLLIMVIGYLGGGMLAILITDPRQDLLSASLIIALCLAFSCVLWSYVNWILSLAPIFVVLKSLSALDSIVEALAFSRRNFSALSAIALSNGTARTLVMCVISVTGFGTVALFAKSSPVLLVLLLALQFLLYLAVSDFLLLALLAAYASVAVCEPARAQTYFSPDHFGTFPR